MSNLTGGDAIPWRLAVGGLLLAILGGKIWVIATYGSATPFWDQWDAEAAGLYGPWFAGTLGVSDLFAPHNEHRILLTRLVALGLLIVRGHWDPLLQMLINAAIHTATAGVLLAILCRRLSLPSRLLLALFTFAFFFVPFGWENTLAGFQLQFYLLLLLATLSLFLLYDAAAGSARWWLGTLVALVSYFSIASGALTLPAFICLAAVQYALGKRSGRAELLGLMFHILVAAALLSDIPSIRAHDPLKAKSVGEAWRAFSAIAAWPTSTVRWPTFVLTLGAAIVQAPALIMALRLLRERPAPNDGRWIYFTLMCWSGLQLAALAYGRGIGALFGPRYYDVYIVGLVVNAACLLDLLGTSPREHSTRNVGRIACGLWLLFILAGAGARAFGPMPRGLKMRHDTAVIQTDHLRRYIETGDAAVLENKPQHHIPYPSSARLIELLALPKIRAILPPALLGQPDTNALEAFVLKRGALLIPIGLAFFLIGTTMARRRA